jgi:hypothetical protein
MGAGAYEVEDGDAQGCGNVDARIGGTGGDADSSEHHAGLRRPGASSKSRTAASNQKTWRPSTPTRRSSPRSAKQRSAPRLKERRRPQRSMSRPAKPRPSWRRTPQSTKPRSTPWSVKPSRTRSGKAANEEPAAVLSERTAVEDLHGILLDRHHEGEGDTRGSWRTRGRVLGPPDLDLVLRWGSLHERWHRGDGSGGCGRDACGRVGVVGVVLGRRGIDGELLLHRQR